MLSIETSGCVDKGVCEVQKVLPMLGKIIDWQCFFNRVISPFLFQCIVVLCCSIPEFFCLQPAPC